MMRFLLGFEFALISTANLKLKLKLKLNQALEGYIALKGYIDICSPYRSPLKSLKPLQTRSTAFQGQLLSALGC